MIFLLACSSTISLPKSPQAQTHEPEPLESIPMGINGCLDAPPVRINEVVAANVQGPQDADGERSDWFELLADQDQDLEGWSLSTDGTPTWTFPAMHLSADRPLLIFASGKDRQDPAALHTSFSLDAMGDALFLHMPDGCVVDYLKISRSYADESLGRPLLRPSVLEWFVSPTPGAPNTTESRPGFAETPLIVPAAGFVDAPVLPSLQGGPILRCTLDSSVPTEQSSLCSETLTAPLQPPMVLRVRAFESGLWPSRIATSTYLEQDLLDKGLTVISLVANPPDLWDDQRGIYVYGPDYEPNYPYFGANFWEEWERDVHVEIWSPEGRLQVQQDAGIQIAGGYSRAFDQRNFELLARTGYGPEKFDSPLFSEEPIAAYRHLYLRNGGDWCSTQIVDGTVQALLRDPSGVRYPEVDAQAYTPVMVYLNGEFWGVYELKERLDEWYIADHHDEDPEALDRIKVGWTHEANWTLDQGSWAAFDALEALVANRDLALPDAWAEFEAQVDTVNLAAAVAAQGWIGNSDWWGNNIRLWKPWRDGGRWHWMVYDFGHGWPNWNYDHLATSVTTTAKGLPIGAALRNPHFRQTFVDVHADLLNTTMAGDYAEAVVTRLADQVRPAMPLQRERWCGGAGMDAWEDAVDYATLFARRRAGAIDLSLMANLGLTAHAQLTLRADPPEGGRFQLTVVEVGSGFTGQYYQGVPVQVTALPAAGWRFVEWVGRGVELTVVLGMAEDTEVVGRFEVQ